MQKNVPGINNGITKAKILELKHLHRVTCVTLSQ